MGHKTVLFLQFSSVIWVSLFISLTRCHLLLALLLQVMRFSCLLGFKCRHLWSYPGVSGDVYLCIFVGSSDTLCILSLCYIPASKHFCRVHVDMARQCKVYSWTRWFTKRVCNLSDSIYEYGFAFINTLLFVTCMPLDKCTMVSIFCFLALKKHGLSF